MCLPSSSSSSLLHGKRKLSNGYDRLTSDYSLISHHGDTDDRDVTSVAAMNLISSLMKHLATRTGRWHRN